MNNTQLFPFERNRYYPKKRMSSSDFTAEQAYHNNKRRFLNGLMYGTGVVCGLGVFSLDDLSILVESGVAIDGMGREIVVETSDVKKLSSLSGFDALRTDNVALCLRYKESDVHKVFAIDQDSPNEEFKYNRIREGYSLFVMDCEDIPEEFQMESEFLAKGYLLVGDNFNVTFMIPSTVSRGHMVRAQVEIEKLTDADVALSYFGTLQTPAFTTANGENVIRVDIQDMKLEKGGKVVKDFWLEAMDVPVATTSIILEAGSMQAFENDIAVEVPSNVMIEVQLSNLKPRELVNREIGRMNLEMRNIGGMLDYIRLADLKLVRTDNAYIIEEVSEIGVKQYIVAPSGDMQREDYKEFFVREPEFKGDGESHPTEEHVEEGGGSQTVAPRIATGVLEIPLGVEARKGDLYYSGEIMHGLGIGNVYVDVGYEYISEFDKAGIDSTAKSTIYGNPDIFAKEQKSVVPAETAVRVLNDKGSFVVGARLLGNVDYLVLNYRWVAIKFPSGENLGEEVVEPGANISPETSTVRMGVKESHYFGVRFTNMDPTSLTYEMTETGSGEITADGVYTAPNKPGVYEIKISCTDIPSICTYAYAIVEKRA